MKDIATVNQATTALPSQAAYETNNMKIPDPRAPVVD
jgi:hypothetical protein